MDRAKIVLEYILLVIVGFMVAEHGILAVLTAQTLTLIVLHLLDNNDKPHIG